MYRILFSALLISASLPTHLLAYDGPGNRDELPTNKIVRKLFQARIGGRDKVLAEYKYTFPCNGVHVTCTANNVSFYSRYTDEHGNRLAQLYMDNHTGRLSQAEGKEGEWTKTKAGTLSRHHKVSLKVLRSLDKDYIASHEGAKPMKHKRIKKREHDRIRKAWDIWSGSSS